VPPFTGRGEDKEEIVLVQNCPAVPAGKNGSFAQRQQGGRSSAGSDDFNVLQLSHCAMGHSLT
jgi:hypothetical protein